MAYYPMKCLDNKVICSNYKLNSALFSRDVSSFTLGDYPRMVQNLICKAHTIGWLMQVSSDGYTPNKRLNLAMGLSSIHIAQLYEVKQQFPVCVISKNPGQPAQMRRLAWVFAVH